MIKLVHKPAKERVKEQEIADDNAQHPYLPFSQLLRFEGDNAPGCPGDKKRCALKVVRDVTTLRVVEFCRLVDELLHFDVDYSNVFLHVFGSYASHIIQKLTLFSRYKVKLIRRL